MNKYSRKALKSPVLELLTGESPEQPSVADPVLSNAWDRTISRSAFQPQPSHDFVIYIFFPPRNRSPHTSSKSNL